VSTAGAALAGAVALQPPDGGELNRAVQALGDIGVVLAAGQAELAVLQQRVETAKAAASDLLSDYTWLTEERRRRCSEATVDVNPLTDQESVVLRLLADGHTDDVIGRRLGLSARTVRRIVAVVMRRLDARSRFEAGVHAVQRGWLSWQQP
jgi:DNA-binding NarL/FixJ family response regulator